jgi:hypothetical protein
MEHEVASFDAFAERGKILEAARQYLDGGAKGRWQPALIAYETGHLDGPTDQAPIEETLGESTADESGCARHQHTEPRLPALGAHDASCYHGY